MKTTDDRSRWDAKHGKHAGQPLDKPDPFVLELLDALGEDLEGRRVLDLACGRGRHAVELARRGASVEAWDFSTVALEDLAHRDPTRSIVTRTVDLSSAERAAFPASRFDVVVLVNFLERELLERVSELVEPGGDFVMVTFTTEREGTRPPLRFCLEPGELARGIHGFETVSTFERGGRAGIHARREVPVT